jgi:glycosyltransferase involved in cell wall biosynthesis
MEEGGSVLVSVVVTNYNYEDYLEEAVLSALEQTHGDLEVILVDDGSTDNSREVIDKLSGAFANVIPHYKPNGGQLSAFNAGVQLARGEVLFFLDADDRYCPDYIEKALAVYGEHPDCDFLFCAYEAFGTVAKKVLKPYPDRVTDLGYTGLVTYCSRIWLGGPTSTISLRRSCAGQFFPIPYEDDWRIRADDCLVWLASLYNGRKYFLNEPLVAYRTHGNNNFFGKARDDQERYLYAHKRAKLFANAAEHMKQYHYLSGKELCVMLHWEAATGRKVELLDAYRQAFRQNYSIPRLYRWRHCRKVKRIIKGTRP